tara:strand:+ start:213 stop:527 length:315 start_codon:yes stop_codon:yes gene_type:complete
LILDGKNSPLVAFILLIIVGPKDLPKVLKSIFKFVDKIKNYAYDFKSSVNDMNDELELSELRKDVLEIKKDNSLTETKKVIVEAEKQFKNLKNTIKPRKKSKNK